jgi:hypothetical protein
MKNTKKRSCLTYSDDTLPGGGMQRMKEAILYISDKCKENETYGATKLNKILFHSDFRSFERRGQPLTGESYQRLPNGPAPLRLCIIRDEMLAKDEIEFIRRPYHSLEQQRIIPKREANITYFNKDDIKILNEIIKELWDDNATETSDKSHGIIWRISENGDRIPYEASLLEEPKITDKHRRRAQALAEKYKW